jgi:hypothetical protein
MAEITALQTSLQRAIGAMEDMEAVLELVKKAEKIQEDYRSVYNGDLDKVLRTPRSSSQGGISQGSSSGIADLCGCQDTIDCGLVGRGEPAPD